MIATVAGDKGALRARIRAARAVRAAARARTAAGTGGTTGELLLETARAAGLLDPAGRPGAVGPITLAAYVAAPGEPDVAAIRCAVRAAGGTVLLPIPLPGRGLGWAFDDGSYANDPVLPVMVPTGPAVGRGAAGLRDQGVRLVLAPALAVDGQGVRLGQGGGFYDMLIRDLDGTIPVLAVVHDEELLPVGSIPREPHDRAVPGVLTDVRVEHFGER